MTLRLSCFPIVVPPGYVDPGFRLRNRTSPCSAEIRFTDDFAADRDWRTPGVQPHNSIDIFGGLGHHIVATTDGQVLETWIFWNGTVVPGAGTEADPGTRGGNFVLILAPDGYVHYYAHMQHEPRVRPSDTVTAGDWIGLLGNTGRARTTCPHLHYQVYAPTRRAPASGLHLDARHFTAVNPHAELTRLRP